MELINLPTRFALFDMNKSIWRGGQPSYHQLKYIKSIGIKHVINLRREDSRQRNRESKQCYELNIGYYEFPHYGIFGINPDIINEIIDFVNTLDGNVYIHCKNGRDRTSLIVASYLVKYHNKIPALAWKEDVIDYDHNENNIFFSRFKPSFEKFCAKINNNDNY